MLIFRRTCCKLIATAELEKEAQELELYEVAQHINILKSPRDDDDKLLVSVHAKAASCEVIMNDAKFHF